MKISIRSNFLALGCAAVFGCIAILAQAPKTADPKAAAVLPEPAASGDAGTKGP